MNLSEKKESEILTLFEPFSSNLVAAPCSWVLYPNRDLERIPGEINKPYDKVLGAAQLIKRVKAYKSL